MVTKTAPASRLAEKDRRALFEIVRSAPTFSRHVLGHDLWEKQEQILTAIERPRARVAVKACHASSKTFTAADAVIWFLARYRDGMVISTAPTWTQVRRLLWAEIRKSAERRFTDLDVLTTEMRGPGGPDNIAMGLSTNEGVRFQGFHGRVLIVMDEALGVAPDIWDAVNGIRAGGDVRVLALGNPTIASGKFFDTFTAPHSTWQTFTISAFDTPNLAGLTIDDVLAMDDDQLDDNVRDYLITRRWVREMYAETGGAGHPEYDARVLAEFPTVGGAGIFPLGWVDAARARDTEPDPLDPWIAGVDVAGPGDDETVVYLRHGSRVLPPRIFNDADARQPVIDYLAPYRDRLATVHTDAIGVGWYFTEALRDAGLPVHGVNVAERSRDPEERFSNLKAEVYWNLRERLQAGEVSNLTDDETRRQLTAILYGTSMGRIAVEDKASYRRRVGGSPDRAEALILAFMPPVAMKTAALPAAPVSIKKVPVSKAVERASLVIPRR